MRIDALRQEGYQLFHEGVIELSRVESNGIRIDTERLARTKEKLRNKIRKLKQEMEESEVWTKIWKRRYGIKSNFSSRDQLAVVLYKEMGFAITGATAGGRASVDTEALQQIDHPFVSQIAQMLKYEKALGTFLKGIEGEMVDDRLHPVFSLHTTRSHRSSSERPNFQNFPVRDKEISKIIRSLFIASPDCVLVDNDFKGIEVSISACYHKDENFISYITTPGKDMHRDMAAQIYKLPVDEVSKDTRYGAKNKFVFPQFYGDFYVTCAKSLWDWIKRGKLQTVTGVPLFDHLKSKGICKLGKCDPEEDPVPGTFEHHLREVENHFWNKRFMAYGQWRKDWYNAYLQKGYFDLLTGFRISGLMKRNAVTNYCVQGSAFHCLLWSLIQINRRLRKYKMKSLIVGQIHDSLVGDIRIDELKDYLEIVEQVTKTELREHYKEWLIVPLETECEISPGNWFQKKEVKFKNGRFPHPADPDKFTEDPHKFVKALRTLQNNE